MKPIAWRKLFKRKDTSIIDPTPSAPAAAAAPTPDEIAILKAVEGAFADQARFEAAHPVAFTRDQRRIAVLARAEIHLGTKLPESGVKTVEAMIP